MDDLAKLLILFGIAITLTGGVLLLFSRIPGLSNFPGTLTFSTDNATCLIPIGVSILLSIILTIILNLVLGALRK